MLYLEAARLFAAEGKESEAKGHGAKAEEPIEETGYYRKKIVMNDE